MQLFNSWFFCAISFCNNFHIEGKIASQCVFEMAYLCYRDNAFRPDSCIVQPDRVYLLMLIYFS